MSKVITKAIQETIESTGPFLMSAKEVGELLLKSPRWVKNNLIKEIPHVKVGAGYRFYRLDVMAWIRANTIDIPAETRREKTNEKRIRRAVLQVVKSFRR